MVPPRWTSTSLVARRKHGPIQFLENYPIQSSFWVRFMCPKTRRNWLRPPIVRFHPGSSCPQAAALRRSHTRGRRPPPFSARSRVSWHTVNLRSAPRAVIIRTSEHFHVFFAAPTLECSDVRLGWQETRKRVLELRRPVTVPRDIRSLGRMNDDRTDLEVFQQCRDLVFGDWTSAPASSLTCWWQQASHQSFPRSAHESERWGLRRPQEPRPWYRSEHRHSG